MSEEMRGGKAQLDRARPLRRRRPREAGFITKSALLLSSALAAFLGVLYGLRPDAFAAVTLFPAWAWLVLAAPLLLIILRLRRGCGRLAAACALAWLAFAVLHVEEPKTILRGMLRRDMSPGPHREDLLRVVSFNCGGGQSAALEEIRALAPDIICLQEAPAEEEVAAFCRELFGEKGSYVWDIDTGIIAGGPAIRLGHPGRAPFFSILRAEAPGAGEVDIVSAHLYTSDPRTDFWNPACWREQRRARKRQLGQMRTLAACLTPPAPVIVAGDFNVPQGDRIFSLLPAGFRDTFAEQGRGLGNTALNDLPLLRIDQLWVSGDFETVRSFAVRSRVSDHRMVVSDIRVTRGR